MDITLSELIVWIIVGALAGSLVSMLVTFSKTGFGHLKNLGLGMAGAVIGGLMVDLFKLKLPLGNIVIRLNDVLVAALGSVVIVVAVWLIQKIRKGKSV